MTYRSKILANAALTILLLGLGGCQNKEFIHVGPNWDAISKLDPGEAGFEVEAKVPSSVKLGEPIEFKVTSEKPGRLWIVSVDREDELSLIFPNDVDPENRIGADETRMIPPPGARWTIDATEPAGENLVAFLITDEDVDLRDIIEGVPIEDSGEKTLRVVSDRHYWGVTTEVMEVKAP